MTALEPSTSTLQFALERARARISVLELMIEDRTRELYLSHQTLSQAHEDLVALHEAMPDWLLIVSPDGKLRRLNASAARQLDLNERRPPATIATLSRELFAALPDIWLELTSGARVSRREATFHSPQGALPMLISVSLLHGPESALVCVAVDLRERKQLELELRQAQKLEAVGQLAAGIAHEINTPLQYIADNLHFIQTAVEGLETMLAAQRSALEPAGPDHPPGDPTALEELREELDLEYVSQNLPHAVQRARDGITRISTLVKAMKVFSHPSRERGPVNVNDCLSTTLIVARNEYKYVADVVTEFGVLPAVLGDAGELNQVFLNLIVNAAHAIEDRHRDTGGRGSITVRTVIEGEAVAVSIADTGCGIPADIAHRIFEPFFTTKEVGRGTGQGLAISRQVVTAHGGSLTFDTVPNEGTTFKVRLPMQLGSA